MSSNMGESICPGYEADCSPERISGVSLDAIAASMFEIQFGQAHVREIIAQGVVKKADETHKTITDEKSGAAAMRVFRHWFPGVPIFTEDSGSIGRMTEKQPRGFMIDGLDGTQPFLEGLDTSTSITTLFNSLTGEFEQTTIGRPSTGEVWYTHNGSTYTMSIDAATALPLSVATEVYVSPERFGPETPVLIELLRGFKRDGGKRQILADGEVGALVEAINLRGVVRQQGSNGLNLAQVASGQEQVAASITTAMGGEWDVAGVLAVINAGGVAQGFRTNADHSLAPSNPLNPFEYDILITANNNETLEYLTGCLRWAVASQSGDRRAGPLRRTS